MTAPKPARCDNCNDTHVETYPCRVCRGDEHHGQVAEVEALRDVEKAARDELTMWPTAGGRCPRAEPCLPCRLHKSLAALDSLRSGRAGG